jgi:hypothetical protein
MKLYFATAGTIAALLLAAGPAMAGAIGGGDPFELNFSYDGSGQVIACSGTCSFTGNDPATAIGGGGSLFALPQTVGTGAVLIDDALGSPDAELVFTATTMAYYSFNCDGNQADICSNTPPVATTFVGTTAAANGAFTYLGPYPTENQYNGQLDSSSAVPEPASSTLLAAALIGFGAARRRRRS